jgi:hypothetical protein
MFALFVGIANACSWTAQLQGPHQPIMARHKADRLLLGEPAARAGQLCAVEDG